MQRGRSGQDQTSDVVGGNGREIEDGGDFEPQMQFLDKVMDIRPPIPVIIQCSCDHAEVSVSRSRCAENTRENPTDAV